MRIFDVFRRPLLKDRTDCEPITQRYPEHSGVILFVINFVSEFWH